MSKLRWTFIPGGRIRKARNPRDVLFEPILPMELKDTVKGTVGSKKSTPCINELIEMMDCLKRCGFAEKPCTPAIQAYTTCNEKFIKREKVKQQRAEEDIRLMSNPRDMGRDQVRTLLKNFPIK